MLSALILIAAPAVAFANDPNANDPYNNNPNKNDQNKSSDMNKTDTNKMSSNLEVTSSAFSDNETIPSEYTCEGRGVSPPLSWSNVPTATKSVAILVEDPDAPKGTFTHWLVTGIPATTTSLDRDATLPTGATAAKNGKGMTGYAPPCPPSGMHHYTFHVYALDIDKPKATTRAAFLTSIKNHTLAQGKITGMVQKQTNTQKQGTMNDYDQPKQDQNQPQTPPYEPQQPNQNR